MPQSTQDPQQISQGLPPTPAQTMPSPPTICLTSALMQEMSVGSMVVTAFKYFCAFLTL